MSLIISTQRTAQMTLFPSTAANFKFALGLFLSSLIISTTLSSTLPTIENTKKNLLNMLKLKRKYFSHLTSMKQEPNENENADPLFAACVQFLLSLVVPRSKLCMMMLKILVIFTMAIIMLDRVRDMAAQQHSHQASTKKKRLWFLFHENKKKKEKHSSQRRGQV